MITTVILDWAGTTVDYGCFAPVQAFVEVFRAYGVEPTMEETRAPMGMLKREHIRTMLAMPRIAAEFVTAQGHTASEQDLDRMYQSFETKLFSILENYCEVKPYVLETVSALRARSITIGSTTGYTDKMMEIVVSGAKAQGYMPDCLVTPEGVGGKGRPYPYMVFENMKTLGVESVSQVLKVGDTISDILEAKYAGVVAVGILEGSSEMGLSKSEYDALSTAEQSALKDTIKTRYQNAGADFVLNHIGDLIPLLDHLNQPR